RECSESPVPGLVADDEWPMGYRFDGSPHEGPGILSQHHVVDVCLTSEADQPCDLTQGAALAIDPVLQFRCTPSTDAPRVAAEPCSIRICNASEGALAAELIDLRNDRGPDQAHGRDRWGRGLA